MGYRIRRVLLASAAMGCTLAAGQAFAQTAQTQAQTQAQPQSQTVEEVIVTAQKREERLQDVPIAVSAFSAQKIEELGFDNVLEVAAQTPNFQIGGLAGSTASVTPWVNIRGIQFTDTSFVNDPSVAMYVDEVYQASTGAGVQQLFDVERVEVLKGPQGSLFGRNSSTGLVQYITKKPTDTFQGYINASYGEYNKRSLEGAVSGPIAPRINGRLAAKYSANDGYRHNPQTGVDDFGETDTKAVRGTLEFKATDNFTVMVGAHYANGDNIWPGRDYRGTREPGNTAVRCANPDDVYAGRCSTRTGFIVSTDDPRITYGIRDSPMTYTVAGGYIRGELEVGGINFVSITGYEDWESYFVQDSGLGPNSFNNVTSDFRNDTTNWSEELRASGSFNESNWVLGAYYYEDKRHNRATVYDWWALMNPGTVTPTASTVGREGEVDTNSAALFGQIETPIATNWTLAIGGRYSKETRDMVIMRRFNGCFVDQCAPTYSGSNSADFSNFSGDVTLRWKPTTNIMAYVKYARGFKSGGWNPSAATVAEAGPADPEVVDDWEGGMKADWLDGRLRTNIAIFHYNFDGLQSTLSQIINGQAVNNFINAGTAKITGSEWEFVYLPIDNLELRLGIGTLDTRIESVATGGLGILPGNALPNAPEFNSNGLAKYTFDLGGMGTLAVQGEFSHQSHVFFTVDNDPYRAMDPYTVYNARLIWNSEDGRYDAQLSIENIENKRYATGAFQTASFDSMYFEPGAPRWWTFKIGAKF